ncbi:MAG: methyltransferase domain-containing protein [Chitinophagaceae bacterium]|nr:methyltransferase domain-containing protein [Chitinophagaceae bacterium]
MLNYPQRSLKTELLDRDDIPFADIRQNMKELNVINTLLGGHRISLSGLKALMKKDQPLHIVEMGCGGGDNLRALQSYLKKNNIPHQLTGIDIKASCIEYAKTVNSDIQFICSDYRSVVFEKQPDIIFNSLFCHHFSQEQLVGMMQWMSEHSKLGFFINDLQRNRIAHASIRLLTKLFSQSYLVKHDAPLSVQRSFVRSDWDILLKPFPQKVIQWKWAFRYLVIVKHAD